ncbi:MAG: UDP-3-O-(3-hydroxymyristoyl)glucosamine N-acyltransferase [Alphaproteobacteria bacterium]|nr:UDP-3-O-(3-hydroxymyristoyl)glucosamine N-acyltransferase [Alphaproteobacteria bacterium]
MVDRAFFQYSGPKSIEDIAKIGECQLVEGTPQGVIIEDVKPLDRAGSKDITFFSNPKYMTVLQKCLATACIIHPRNLDLIPDTVIPLVSENPYYSFAKISNSFYPQIVFSPGLSPQAFISPSATIGGGTCVEPGAHVQDGAKIGERCYIGPNVIIGRNVVIGHDSVIHANCTVFCSIIGDFVVLHPGVRIGQDGFGFATHKGVHVKVPQLGRVIIHSYVEIGANTTIDRGSGPDTIIGEGSQIDNLVQIGHNVEMGKGCVIVSQVGIAGSTKLGNYVVCGGQVGIAGHLRIGDGVQIAAKSGVSDDIRPGEKMGGIPAVPMKEWLQQVMAIKKLIRKRPGSYHNDEEDYDNYNNYDDRYQ